MPERHHGFPQSLTASDVLASLIPAQHRQIHKWLTRLESFGNETIDSEQFLEALQRVENALVTNMVVEEQFLKARRMDSARIAQHTKSHNEILEFVTDIYFSAMQRSQRTAGDVAQKLRKMVEEHITQLDAQLGENDPSNRRKS